MSEIEILTASLLIGGVVGVFVYWILSWILGSSE